MKNFKKFFSLILFFCAFLFLTGCANIQHIRLSYESGITIDKIFIELKANEFTQTQLSQLDENIKSDMNSYKVAVDNWKANMIESLHGEEFTTYATAISSGVSCNVEFNNYKYMATTKFDTAELFSMFYETGNDEFSTKSEDIGPFTDFVINRSSKNSETINDFLYKYSIRTDDCILKYIDKVHISGGYGSLYSKYYELLNDEPYNSSNALDLEGLSISQIFATDASKIHSNADSETKENGLTVYSWDLTNKTSDYELEIYKLGARTSAWYIVGLFSSIFIALILVVIALIRKKIKLCDVGKNKEKTKNINGKIKIKSRVEKNKNIKD